MQYLLILDDLCLSSLLGLEDGLNLLRALINLPTHSNIKAARDIRDWLEAAANDIEYLQTEVKAAQQKIADLRVMVGHSPTSGLCP